MTSLFAKKHLRLVSHSAGERNHDDFYRDRIVEDNVKKCKEISISFYFISEANVLRSVGFSTYLFERKARAFFDIRIAPRLDFIATNRVLAFKKLANLEIDYIDIVGAIDNGVIGTNPEDWCPLISAEIKGINSGNHSFFFVFDNEQVLRRAQNVIPSVIQEMSIHSECHFEVVNEAAERIAM